MTAVLGFLCLLIVLTVLIRYCTYDYLPIEPYNWGWWPAFGYAFGITFLVFVVWMAYQMGKQEGKKQ